MGLLDSVVGMMGQLQGGQGGQGGGNPALMSALIGLLGQDASGGGGLAGLVQQFEQGGLGHVIGSWISTGQNLPISAEQLQSVLGSGVLASLAQQTGLSHGDLAGQLAQWLPQVVDHATPDGQLPAGGAGGPGDLAGLLGGLLGR